MILNSVILESEADHFELLYINKFFFDQNYNNKKEDISKIKK